MENKRSDGKGNIHPMNKCSMLIIMSVLFLSCGTKTNSDELSTIVETNSGSVTFIELGGDNCIPCKQMQPVLESIRFRYGNRVNVIFYDVWKPEQKSMAQKYKIRLIPTQVFIDSEGTEYYRHEGFFPELDIDRILALEGIFPLKRT